MKFVAEVSVSGLRCLIRGDTKISDFLNSPVYLYSPFAKKVSRRY
jgi:hypothetical protein